MFYMALMRLRKCIFLHTVSPSKIHNSCIIFHISRSRKLAISNEKAAEKNIKEIATGILDKPETDKGDRQARSVDKNNVQFSTETPNGRKQMRPINLNLL